MASNTPFKPKQDKEYNIDKDTVNSIIKKRFNTKKKPKKFTWKGLYDFTSILETNPFSPRKLQRIKELSGHIKNTEKKLANKNFVDRAPENVVKHENQKLKDMTTEFKLVKANLDMLQ